MIEKVALLGSDDRRSVGSKRRVVHGPSVTSQTTLVSRVLRVLSAQVYQDSEIDFVRIVLSRRPSGCTLIIIQDVHRKHPESTKENTVCPYQFQRSPTLPQRGTSQHNGEISQGAWKTFKSRPWVMQMIIYGFPSTLAALQFEWAWQHPHASRHLRDPLGKPLFKKERGSLKKNILYVHAFTEDPHSLTRCTFAHTFQGGQDNGYHTSLQHVATPRQVFHQYVKGSVG